MDFCFDDISRGRRIKIGNVTDEFTREALAGRVARHLTAKDTVAVLEQIVGERGAPTHIRCDIQTDFAPLDAWIGRPAARGSEGSGARPPSLGHAIGAHGATPKLRIVLARETPFRLQGFLHEVDISP